MRLAPTWGVYVQRDGRRAGAVARGAAMIASPRWSFAR
jgi:hypothetical protein